MKLQRKEASDKKRSRNGNTKLYSCIMYTIVLLVVWPSFRTKSEHFQNHSLTTMVKVFLN